MAPNKNNRKSKNKSDETHTSQPPEASSSSSPTAPSPPPGSLLRHAGLYILALLAAPTSQLSLAPVFGAIPSSPYHRLTLSLGLGLGLALPLILLLLPGGGPPRPPVVAAQLAATWAFWIPATQSFITAHSARLGPTYGPALMQGVGCYVSVVAAGYGVGGAVFGFGNPRALAMRSHAALLRYLVAAFFLAFALHPMLDAAAAHVVEAALAVWPGVMPVHLQLGAAVLHVPLVPLSWLSLLAIPALLHAPSNPHLSGPRANHSLAPQGWMLLERQWSTTGYISVVQSTTDDYRLLRADHSLLGGQWLLTAARATQQGWRVPEPVYAVFTMLESVRLMPADPVPDAAARALVIGLGIGTAPDALLRHGVDTTVVELDPVVHRFAMRWFGLLPNHTAVLEDAVGWVEGRARETTTTTTTTRRKYDYIIHDVFTGGAEPLALFNTAFLRNLRTLLTSDGAIALNYAGDLSLPLTRLVLRTIAHTFDGQCKIFRDSPPEKHDAAGTNTKNANAKVKKRKNGEVDEGVRDDGDDDGSDFVNMVVFCRNSPGPISFRTPTNRDFLGSFNRKNYMLPKPELEIPFPKQSPSVSGEENRYLEPGDEESWSSQQVEGARRHWRIMRQVIPDVVWESW